MPEFQLLMTMLSFNTIAIYYNLVPFVVINVSPNMLAMYNNYMICQRPCSLSLVLLYIMYYANMYVCVAIDAGLNSYI